MKQIFFFLGLLGITSLACSTNIHLPQPNIGKTETLSINEPVPDAKSSPAMEITMGAGSLTLESGAKGFAQGEVRYNIPDWKPVITRTEDRVSITQSGGNITSLPGDTVINEWKLKLGQTPMDLSIHAGAYKGTINLGGVPITRLDISDGASQTNLRFDSPNPEKMARFIYQTGASKVEISGLSNANFAIMDFSGGAGSYILDFSGKLQQDADVIFKSGVSNVKLIIPRNTPAKVTISGGMTNVSFTGTWTSSNSVYETSGTGPKLTIDVEMGIGNLELISQ